jgi:hypothetical protein
MRAWETLIVRAAAAVGPAVLLIVAACADSVSGPQAESCGSPPYFTVLPVAENELAGVSVFGGIDAPGHTLPTAHGGIFVTRANVMVRAPGNMAVTSLRRARYLSSGQEDYAINFQVCEAVTGWFGHVTSFAPVLSPGSINWRNCSTYSIPATAIEACTADGLDIRVSAGDPLATGGPVAIDFGVVDDRVNNFYVAPARHPPDRFHAICMWEQFDAANQAVLFGKLRDIARPTVMPGGNPRCGTMAVDVAGSAKGVWAEIGVSGPAGGDERRYITLANYPYRPQDELALSLGPATLGARMAYVPRRTTGRVNRAFEQVTADGQIYCYGPDIGRFASGSWLLSLSGATLRMEWRNHQAGASPCNADPATWSLGANAVSLVR